MFKRSKLPPIPGAPIGYQSLDEQDTTSLDSYAHNANAQEVRNAIEEFTTYYEQCEQKKNVPSYQDIVLGTQPYLLDYKGYRHVFAYNTSGTAVNLTTLDGITFALPAQTWSNISFRDGTRFTGSAVAILLIKCTNEPIP